MRTTILLDRHITAPGDGVSEVLDTTRYTYLAVMVSVVTGVVHVMLDRRLNGRWETVAEHAFDPAGGYDEHGPACDVGPGMPHPLLITEHARVRWVPNPGPVDMYITVGGAG